MEIQANPAPLTRPETALVLGGNLIPLLGAVLWEWSVFEIMFLYWMENLVIGQVTLFLIVTAGAREGIAGLFGGLFMAVFFTVHYGLFCMAHGVFVIEIFHPAPPEGLSSSGLFAPIEFLRTAELWSGFLWAVGGIALVQLAQTLHNAGRLKKRNPAEIMMSPYARIVILHVTLIFGGMLVMTLETPLAGLVFLIVLKTAFDLGLVRNIKARKKNNDAGRNQNT